MWAPDFCLSCDKQTYQTAYCSESCRLAEFEKTSVCSSTPSSPGLPAAYPWTSPSTMFLPAPHSAPSSSGLLRLSATNGFSNRSMSATLLAVSSASLSPSTSLTSLSSLGSNYNSPPPYLLAPQPDQLSGQIKRELQAYAVSLEQVRLQRCRSC